MRVIGGRLGGRTLKVSLSKGTRPTTDRVREGVASALESRGAIVGARVLDLFAGSGAYGFEAISRGAVSVLAVDNDRSALTTMKTCATALEVNDLHRALGFDLLSNAARAVERLREVHPEPFDLVFVDPPYAQAVAAAAMVEMLCEGGLAPDGWVLFEHAGREPAPPLAGLAQTATYRYGDSAAALFGAANEQEADP